MRFRRLLGMTVVGASLVGLMGGCSQNQHEQEAMKPVLYLYPEAKTDVDVRLDYQGRLTTTYPEYDEGWSVTASPDGSLVNKADGLEYSYLFWEGVDQAEYDLSEGFVVRGKDTASFLQEVLPEIGLLPKEYNEFIVYWLPQMEDNPYNLITFQTNAYEAVAPLHIAPEPDSILRVFMAFKPLTVPVEVQEPEIIPFVRSGFTVVEWGGVNLG